MPESPARRAIDRRAGRFRIVPPIAWLGAAILAGTAGVAGYAETPPAQVDPSEPSPLRWDDLRAGRPPVLHLFSREYPAALFPRPAELGLDTWFLDGHLRTYAMLNLSDVVRSVEIRRGHGPVYMFGNARVPHLLDDVTATLDDKRFPKAGTPIPLREFYSWTNGQAILVARHGKIVYEEYTGMDPSQRHHWMSVSKSVLNVLLGKLVGEGRLDLRRKVEDYVPELKDKGYGSFTVQELADMDADVDVNENNYHDPKTRFGEFGRSMGWFGDDGRWPGGVRQFLQTCGRLERPTGEAGQKVRYTSTSSQVIAWIIENVTREPMTEYVQQTIWRHLGAVADATVTVDRHGVPFAGGGYSSTLRDLARFGLIWANGGVAPDGTRLFDESWMKENTSGKGLAIFKTYRYRNQSYSKGTAIAHQGHSSQMLWANPASGTLVVGFGSLTYPGGLGPWSAQAQLLMAEAIDQHLQARRIAESAR